MSRFADTRLRLMIRAAKVAGTAVRIVRGRAVPGLAGAGGVSVALGEVAGHVFGRGLAPWVSLLAGGALLMWIGHEVNEVPAGPAPQDSGEL